MQSNCVAVQPVETEFGRKRQIDQSNCNKDFSCVKGFSILRDGAWRQDQEGRSPRSLATDGMAFRRCPIRRSRLHRPHLQRDRDGVGGTGVVTIGAILGMAAHLEGKGLGMIDMAGLAQKGGAVYSHVRLANNTRTTSTPSA